MAAVPKDAELVTLDGLDVEIRGIKAAAGEVDDDEASSAGRWGVLGTTIVAFFLAEMGDKTQIATVALAARFHDFVWVVAGTTLGMMLANVPAVYLGEAATRIVPLKYVRIGAALIFLGIGLWGIASLLGLFK